MEAEEITSFLRNLPLFSTCSKPFLIELTDHCSSKFVERGSVIFEEDTSGNRIYFVYSGRVAIYKRYGKSTEKLLSLLLPGELFGEMSLFAEEKRTATAVCEENCEVISIPSSSMQAIFDKYPQESMSIVQTMLRTMGTRLERTSLELACIYKISQIIANVVFSASGMNLFLSAVCNEIYNIIPSELTMGIYIYLYNTQEQEMSLVSGCYVKKLPLQKKMRLSSPEFSHLQTLNPIEFEEEDGQIHVFGIPMLYDGKLIGFTLLRSSNGQVPYRFRNLVSSVSHLIAPTVHTLRTYQRN